MSTAALTDAHLNDPVAAHVRQDYATLYPEWTVGQALDHMRTHPPPGRIIYFYVVDADLRLRGVVPTRRLLLSAADARVADIMIKEVIAVPADATVLDACEFFSLHRLLAFPVVDAGRRLIGTIDVEVYTSELLQTTDEGEVDTRHDVFQLIGVRLTRGQQANPLRAFRGRFPWLLCNVGGGLVAAVLSGVYQRELSWNDAVLALFIPVVLALAESVAIQSVTLTLDGFHGQKPSWRDLLRRTRYEGLTGVLMGAAAGVLVAAVAVAWTGERALFGVLLGGITVGVTSAAVAGLAVPYLLHLSRRDPQLAAGPIALAVADMLTLLAYFNLARVMTS